MKILESVEELAIKHSLLHCIVFGWDGKSEQVLTWGCDISESSQAADFGNRLKDHLGWPKNLHRQPHRVRQLQTRIKELEARIRKLEGKDKPERKNQSVELATKSGDRLNA